MLFKVRAKMRDRLAEARIRETNFLMSFNMNSVNDRLLVLLSVFIALNFFDALTTLLAIHVGPAFVELNPVASGLFHLDFGGFVLAIALKYLPLIPLTYATFLRGDGVRPLTLRIVKVSAFVALVAADLFYGAVVGSNTLNLSAFYFHVG
jgi:uncharacterized protein DUF5658